MKIFNFIKEVLQYAGNHHSVMPFGTLADDYRKKEKVS